MFYIRVQKNVWRFGPAVLQRDGLEARVGLVARRLGDGHLLLGPHRRVVVGAGVLVQPVPLVLAAEAVVAGAAAVDVAAFGAVEGAVEVSHHVEVSPEEHRDQLVPPSCRHHTDSPGPGARTLPPTDSRNQKDH